MIFYIPGPQQFSLPPPSPSPVILDHDTTSSDSDDDCSSLEWPAFRLHTDSDFNSFLINLFFIFFLLLLSFLIYLFFIFFFLLSLSLQVFNKYLINVNTFRFNSMMFEWFLNSKLLLLGLIKRKFKLFGKGKLIKFGYLNYKLAIGYKPTVAIWG